ncbi:hypothetical protein Thpro_020770 [Acidihalobacter prosperus]|uniref:Uncharacterized protein n=1 Tax=Acidihalobacter prosperus TaxID=160660 RepID=A0A1A6C927_9GAMM|nr:hypothetical protein Thpro_020770 [Acidihalobacter prosperus]
MAERERAIKENFKEKLAEAKLEIAQLKNDLKEVVKREVALLKLFDAREKAITKFAETWQKKELAKLQRVAAPKKRRGRPRKASS